MSYSTILIILHRSERGTDEGIWINERYFMYQKDQEEDVQKENAQEENVGGILCSRNKIYRRGCDKRSHTEIEITIPFMTNVTIV